MWQAFVQFPWLWGAAALFSGFVVWGAIQSTKRKSLEQKLPGLVILEAENTQLKAENVRLQALVEELQVIKGESNQKTLQLENLIQKQSEQTSAYEALSKLHADSQTELAGLKSRMVSEREAFEEKLHILDEAKQSLSDQFKVLSNEILEQKKAQMTEQSKETLNHLIQPMQTSLEQFKQRMDVVHKEEVAGRASLSEQLKQLKELNQTMSEEAHNLTKALKGDKKLQGNWGELILKKMLETSGLREGIEFDAEKSFTQEDGHRLRPDIIVNLPDKKHIIIDSKVSMVDYEQALNAEDDELRNRHVKAHLNSLRKHITALSTKRYEHLDLLTAPDFVLMFIPIEGAYLMAIEQDASVFESAFEQKVAVVTPTTLFTTLKTVEQLWRYERQSEHTVKLIKRAAEVHDKFVGFIDNFEKIGKQLNLAQASYDSALRQMTQGKGNLVRQAEMLKELAGKTKKEMPVHLLEVAEGQSILSVDDKNN